MAWSVDANVLIQAQNAWYPQEHFPSYWAHLDQMAKEGKVFVVEEVYNEIIGGRDDDLSRWLKVRRDWWYQNGKRDVRVLTRLKEIQRSIRNGANSYAPLVLKEFEEGADPYIIAHALEYGHTVVTGEISAPDSQRRIKIPDVCAIMGVQYTGPIQWVRKIGLRL